MLYKISDTFYCDIDEILFVDTVEENIRVMFKSHPKSCFPIYILTDSEEGKNLLRLLFNLTRETLTI